ncbi:MAG: 2-hydroxyacyl-CoA dehydratase family protein [Caldisericia bacterium]|jgi:benzoyl-CoA reductase/2-hydroxyglutaryl-CoA dehydratase subunit BcrC/BadD/HgdB|nr:2-hydroxyacyl-CoA dehydratase family protein [Caldisericia bacterium]
MNLKDLNEIREFFYENFKKSLNDSHVFFYFCSYIPVEIIYASNYKPVRFITDSIQFTHSDEVSPKYICPYLKSTIEFLINNNLDRKNFIFTDGCDSSRRIYEIYKDLGFLNNSFYIKIPFNESESDINFLKIQFENLFKTINGNIDNEKLINSINLYNEGRKKLKSLIVNYKEASINIFYLNLLFHIMDIKEFLNLNPEFYKESKKEKEGSFYLLSTIFPLSFIEYLYSLRYEIYYDDSCFGYKNLELVKDYLKDPIYSLAKYYIKREGCARRRVLEEKIDRIIQRFKEFSLDGVIVYNLKYCDPLIFYLPLIKEKLNREKIPILIIEDDYSMNIKGQIRTRIEAFMEMLK